jgi:esterase
MSEGKIRSQNVEIWWDSFGDPDHPAVLLVMGANGQAVAWPPYFVDPLVDRGYHVIRFDNRDIGLSTWIDWDNEPYTLADMAADGVAVLDSLGIDRAHWIGASMGGMISQQTALDFPDRVASLTSIMSTPSSPNDPDLPGMSPEVQAAAEKMGTATDDPIQAAIDVFRVLSGSKYPFDEDAFRREFMKGVVRGGFNPKCAHAQALTISPSRRERLWSVTIPSLVLHGDEDPILPIEHGRATAEAIPDARLVVVEGVGHELPAGAVADYMKAIFELLDSAG